MRRVRDVWALYSSRRAAESTRDKLDGQVLPLSTGSEPLVAELTLSRPWRLAVQMEGLAESAVEATSAALLSLAKRLDQAAKLPAEAGVDGEWAAEQCKAAEGALEYLDKAQALDGEFGGKVARAVEAFYEENTVSEGEERFLCPLSGKRFKGREFVKKHIDNKHGEALEAVKEKALLDKFLRLFLLDPHKPPQAQRTVLRGSYATQAVQRALGASDSRRRPERGSFERGGGDRGRGDERGGYERGGGELGERGMERGSMPFIPRDPRQLRQYVDLDAPNDDGFGRAPPPERKPVVYD
ncbi:arsenite-resistance protein 2-domain-containing protein [Pavlovales sp. CCMP2436]|nr:arsenite-resistance protein 2-domain-containing protein [Pavlovales sp. CCMP2436]